MPITLASPHDCGPVYFTDALILSTLSDYRPPQPISTDDWLHIKRLTLAYNNLANPAPIHVVIGVDLYGYMLRDGLRQGKQGEPTAQNTVFGY